MKKITHLGVLGLVLFLGRIQAQFAATGTTTVSVTIGSEAAIQINTATTTLSSLGIVRGNKPINDDNIAA